MSTQINPYDHFAHEDEYPGIDYDAACMRLAKALSCKTVYTGPETTDWSEFYRFQDHLRASFPRVMAAGTFELVGHSVLIRVPGTEPETPDGANAVQLIAHQDVVPVVPGTEGEWVHGAFEGYVDDEWVWGRGALDIKDMLMAELEAVEHLLASGKKPAKTIYLTFGEDEEVRSLGATALAAEMAKRGIRTQWLIDEGTTTFFDGAAYGAPGTVVSDICISQKGYLDIKLTAKGAGGHSSNPFGGTSLERLCRAVARITDAKPAPELGSIVAGTFKALAPHITEEPFAGLVGDVEANSGSIAESAAQVRELYPFVCTTVAVDCLDGGSPAANVMPGDVRDHQLPPAPRHHGRRGPRHGRERHRGHRRRREHRPRDAGRPRGLRRGSRLRRAQGIPRALPPGLRLGTVLRLRRHRLRPLRGRLRLHNARLPLQAGAGGRGPRRPRRQRAHLSPHVRPGHPRPRTPSGAHGVFRRGLMCRMR